MISVQFFTFNPFQENTYVLFSDDGQAIIVDPGCYEKQENEELLSFIEEKKLRVVQLINTHCHIDHVLGNQLVAATFSLELFIHKYEEQVLAFAPQTGAMYGVPFTHYDGPLHFLAAGDKVQLGKDELDVLLTPGHSPGSICLYNAAGNFVIAGDVLFKDSIGRTDLPGGNHEALLQSIRTTLFTLLGDTIVYPGHGPSTTIGYEIKNNPFFN